MRCRVRLTEAAVLCAALLFPSNAAGESIHVTSGFLVYWGPFELIGDERGFQLFGGFYGDAGGPSSRVFCDTCTPGELVVIQHAFNGLDLSAQLMVDGVFYEQVNRVTPPYVEIGFQGSVRLPPFSTEAVQRAPFVMQGALTLPNGEPFVPLVGSGLATMTWNPADNGSGGQRWFLSALRYDFSPAPIPEPASLTLLGLGLAGAGIFRRRHARIGQTTRSRATDGR